MAGARAGGRVPVGLETDESVVVEFGVGAIEGEPAEIAFEADQPVGMELPVVTRRQAERDAALVDVGLAAVAARRAGRRAALLVADGVGVVAADIEAGPVV